LNEPDLRTGRKACRFWAFRFSCKRDFTATFCIWHLALFHLTPKLPIILFIWGDTDDLFEERLYRRPPRKTIVEIAHNKHLRSPLHVGAHLIFGLAPIVIRIVDLFVVDEKTFELLIVVSQVLMNSLGAPQQHSAFTAHS
jgi:hypothetical protein